MTSAGRDIFRFKQFELTNAGCGMRIGTDAVLLGALAPVAGLDSDSVVYDLGAGTGVIALMVAQRTDALPQIFCVEIDPQAAGLCRANVSGTPLGCRTRVLCADAADMPDLPLADLIVSNPPYFANGATAPDPQRALARHDGTLGPLSLVDIAVRSLTPAGRLCMIIPADRLEAVEVHAVLRGMTVTDTIYILPKPDADPIRVIVTLHHNRVKIKPSYSRIALRDPDGVYSDSYRRLTAPFYTHLR